jgi:hypothetical protein
MSTFLRSRERIGNCSVFSWASAAWQYELLPVGQHRHVPDLALGKPPASLARRLEQDQRALIDVELAQLRGLRGEDVAQRAETIEQPLGQRLGVDALDQIEEQEFEQLVVFQQLREKNTPSGAGTPWGGRYPVVPAARG